jgi:CheY-like chemotaxis protein
MTNGPIIIVDDDQDDHEIYEVAIKGIGLPNALRFYDHADAALEYLYHTKEQPFIILSDVNMPRMSGLQFKERIQADDVLRSKGIPFVFISTNANAEVVRKAHVLSVQGYFQKPSSLAEMQRMLSVLFEYWELCRHINNT